MKKLERITAKIQADKDVMKRISKLNYYSPEQFVKDAQKYISAIEQRRMVCIIHSVSQSGMSRTMSFHSCEKYKEKGRYGYRQYACLFLSLGYRESNNRYGFLIGGCGMDMVFATNYNVIHALYRRGFMDKKTCERLAQATPDCL